MVGRHATQQLTATLVQLLGYAGLEGWLRIALLYPCCEIADACPLSVFHGCCLVRKHAMDE